jgi:EmrB/QacA subfamily drug resistance transporter
MAQAITSDIPLGELLKHRQKIVLMVSLMLCMFVSALDNAIVSTATPRILADLGGFHQLSWVFTVYMLSSTVVVPIVGKLSDMFGRKLFLIGGVVLFVAASVLVGAAPTMGFLIFARGLQGAGGGIIFSCVFATLGDLFPPAERGKYTGFFTGTFTLASLSGPTVGGLITDSIGWRWCFYINLPIGIAAVYFISRNLPFRKKGGRLADIDFLGATLLSGATVSLLLALVWAQKEFGWVSAETIGLTVTSLVLVVAFAFQERRHPQAIFPLMLFRNRVFVQANLIVMVSGAGIFGAIQYLPTFLQTSLGQSATNSGLVNTPQSLGLLATSIIGGQVLSRTGRFKYQLIVGAALSLIATILLRTLDVGIPLWHIPVFMGIYGLGSGMIGPTMSVISQSAVDHKFLGVATSGRQFFMQIGNVLGAAIFGVVLSTSYSNSFNANVTDEAKAALPPAIYQTFEDPTSELDKRNFPRIEEQVRALPNGEEILATTIAAQKEGVARAIQNIFLGSIFAAVAVLILAITIPEIPLRRGFGAAAVSAPGSSAAPSGPAVARQATESRPATEPRTD